VALTMARVTSLVTITLAYTGHAAKSCCESCRYGTNLDPHSSIRCQLKEGERHHPLLTLLFRGFMQ
jgi:hypothetical protein